MRFRRRNSSSSVGSIKNCCLFCVNRITLNEKGVPTPRNVVGTSSPGFPYSRVFEFLGSLPGLDHASFFVGEPHGVRLEIEQQYGAPLIASNSPSFFHPLPQRPPLHPRRCGLCIADTLEAWSMAPARSALSIQGYH